MKVLTRVAVKPWEVTAQNGDYFALQLGKAYTVSPPWDDGTVTVFSQFWVRVPALHFLENRRTTSERRRGNEALSGPS